MLYIGTGKKLIAIGPVERVVSEMLMLVCAHNKFLLYTSALEGADDDCDVDQGDWSLETTNGDYVRVPNAMLMTGCKVHNTTPTIFDFDGSDNGFTKFTETDTRECARSLSNSNNRVHYVAYHDDLTTPSRANQIHLLSYSATDSSTNLKETLESGEILDDYLGSDTLYGGRTYLPGSTCPKINTVHQYEMY